METSNYRIEFYDKDSQWVSVWVKDGDTELMWGVLRAASSVPPGVVTVRRTNEDYK
jgi:hypothetical protein